MQCVFTTGLVQESSNVRHLYTILLSGGVSHMVVLLVGALDCLLTPAKCMRMPVHM